MELFNLHRDLDAYLQLVVLDWVPALEQKTTKQARKLEREEGFSSVSAESSIGSRVQVGSVWPN